MSPLVAQVIKEDLHINTEITRFNQGLIEGLVAHGNYKIVERMEEWDCKGSLIEFLRGILVEELRTVKKAYNSRFPDWQVRLDESQPRKHSRDTTKKDYILSDWNLPEDNVSLLDDEERPFDINLEEIIARRDAASGASVISAENKQRLTASLERLFTHSKLFSIFENGTGQRWALFTIGSLGRLGTALKGNCDWNATVLTDLSNDLINKTLKTLAECLGGKLQENGSRLPTVIIGKEGDYKKVIRKSNGNLTGRLISMLKKFGVGSPERGFATIEAVSVNGQEDLNIDSEVPVERAHSRALIYTGPEDFSFQVGPNGILVAESHKGASQRLIEQLVNKVRSNGLVGFAEDRLYVVSRFLEKQKDHLIKAENINNHGLEKMVDDILPDTTRKKKKSWERKAFTISPLLMVLVPFIVLGAFGVHFWPQISPYIQQALQHYQVSIGASGLPQGVQNASFLPQMNILSKSLPNSLNLTGISPWTWSVASEALLWSIGIILGLSIILPIIIFGLAVGFKKYRAHSSLGDSGMYLFKMPETSKFRPGEPVLFAGCDTYIDGLEGYELGTLAEKVARTIEKAAKVYEKRTGKKAIVAALSYATRNKEAKELSPDSFVRYMEKAVEIVRERCPEINILGVTQADAAMRIEVFLDKTKSDSVPEGFPANVFVFPNSQSFEIAKDMMEFFKSCPAIGKESKLASKYLEELERIAESKQALIVVPESTNPRVLAAVERFLAKGLGEVVLLGKKSKIKSVAAKQKEKINIRGAEIIDPEKHPEEIRELVKRYCELQGLYGRAKKC
ncbi:hypothetical protein ES705_35147 [subsurface metagenome]